MKTGRIAVSNQDFYCGAGNGAVCQLALKSDIPNITPYVHPSTIQCNAASEINSLKSSVSNGKSAIASAITGKGVSTSASATFQEMANNINSLSISPVINIQYLNGLISACAQAPSDVSVANYDGFKIVSAPTIRYTYYNCILTPRLRGMGGTSDYNHLEWYNSQYTMSAHNYQLKITYNYISNVLTLQSRPGDANCRFTSTTLSLTSDLRLRITINLALEGSFYLLESGDPVVIIESNFTTFSTQTKASESFTTYTVQVSYNSVTLAVS